HTTPAPSALCARAEGAPPPSHTAKRELRALLEQARRGLTRRERARGLLSLRSLARSWRVDGRVSAGSGTWGCHARIDLQPLPARPLPPAGGHGRPGDRRAREGE